MKLKSIFLYLSAALLFNSCTDQLDQFPETQILDDNFFSTEENVELTVTASYNTLQALYDYYMILWGEIPSDNTYVQAPNSNTGVSLLEDFSWTSTTGFTTSIWGNSYKGITFTNTVLQQIDAIPFESEGLKEVRKGEMLFIRGLLYDNLTTIYGDVPLVLEINDPTYAFDDTRTPKAEVYAQIERDLLDAISKLPVNNSTGRADAYAARAILARFYMKVQDFAKAQTQLDAIINSERFDLIPIDQLYGVENEGNSEEIFSVQYASDLDGRSEGSSYYYNFTLPDNAGGRGAMAMEHSLFEQFEANDLRKGFINNSGNNYYINKWTPSPNSERADGGDNHYLIRYADVLLRMAECMNELGDQTAAAVYLNMVRNRAGLDETTATTQPGLRTAIATERRLELVGEGHRWPDLLRTNTAVQTMNSFFQSQNRGITVEDYQLLAPIPQSEIDLTNMTQNSDY